MEIEVLKRLLNGVAEGKTDVSSALEQLKELPYEDIGIARVDNHRALRTGMGEVVFGRGKAPEHIAHIVETQLNRGSNVLVTLCTPTAAQMTDERLTKAGIDLPDDRYDKIARTYCIRPQPWADRGRGVVKVVAAGTSDLPVAREALITSTFFGNRTELITDVGVAGLHRLLAVKNDLAEAEVVIAVAGMEGALPGVLGGLIDRPVIGVPTSTGYGTGAGGFSALLTMLNSCAPGVSVVNIDNGIGAGSMAALIANRAVRQTP